MSNFFSLMKVQFMNVVNVMFGKKRNKSALQMAGLVAIFVLAIGASFASMYLQMAKQLSQVGMTEMVFLQAGIVTVLFVVMLVAIESQTGFFKAKDYEFLASLPIKNSSIVFSKYVSILCSAYIYSFMTLIPSIIIYFIFAGFNIGVFFLLILVFLLFPMLPCFVGIIIGFIGAWISSKLSGSKIFNLLFTLVLVAGSVMFSSNYQNIIAFYTEKGSGFVSALCYALPSVGLFIDGVFNSNILTLLLFIAVNLFSIILSILLVTSSYKRINLSLGKHSKYKTNKKIDYTPKKIVGRLLATESDRFFGTTIYSSNCLAMSMVGIVAPFVFRFSQSLFENVPSYMLGVILILILCVAAGSTNISSVSISMEGQKFQNLKSMPVKVRTILLSKTLFNVIVAEFCMVLSAIITCALFFGKFSVLTYVAMFVLPLFVTCACSQFGLLMNLLCPKMKFENYNQVVKQSLSSMLGLMGGMVISALPFVIYLLLPGVLTINLFLLITLLYYFILNIIFFILLNTKGEKLFNKIQI